jgi:Fic family protein
MNSFENSFDRRLPLTHALVKSLGLLREYRGKEQLYREQVPQVLETLKQVAMIQSTESSNRIEGVVAPPQRIRDLVANKTTPKDRSEQEIAGYRDVLGLIHGNFQDMKLTSGLVLQLHRGLFKYTDERGGRWKAAPNRISHVQADGTELIRFESLAPHLVQEAMENLHRQFSRLWQDDEIEKLLLIPAYILDFLCIHPFRDGNGRMARLLTLLLLYQAGYQVGRFVGLETIIENSKETYYDSLYKSSQGWHKGRHPLTPWTEYLLGTLIAAYREFEERVGGVSGGRGAKTDLVLRTIETFIGEFTVGQVQERCPTVGIDLIRRILREQKQSGALECLGRGPAAAWRRI